MIITLGNELDDHKSTECKQSSVQIWHDPGVGTSSEKGRSRLHRKNQPYMSELVFYEENGTGKFDCHQLSRTAQSIKLCVFFSFFSRFRTKNKAQGLDESDRAG